MSVLSGRFQILCHLCGYVSAEYTLKEALATAQRVSKHHKEEGGCIVYDLMAHKGKANLWDANGQIIAWKGK